LGAVGLDPDNEKYRGACGAFSLEEEETMEMEMEQKFFKLVTEKREKKKASKKPTKRVHGGEMAVAVSSSTMELMAMKFQTSQPARSV
jgi:hypothetical protein